MTITLPPEAEQALIDEAAREQKTPEQVAMEAMLAGLRNRRVPQTLDELPRRPISGKALRELMAETPWPHDESDQTDEEIERILNDLS